MNFYNTNIIRNHDYIMDLNAGWVEYLNFLLSIHSIIPDWELKLIEDEMQGTICYDV